jgi:hypothetical protein
MSLLGNSKYGTEILFVAYLCYRVYSTKDDIDRDMIVVNVTNKEGQILEYRLIA